MAALHGLQAESEIFRNGECSQHDEEEDYEEYRRRMRAAAKAKAAPRSSCKTSAPARAPAAATSTQETLEKEHATRLESRSELVKREARVDTVLSATLGSDALKGSSDPVTLDMMRAELQANERAMQTDIVEFVGSFGK